MARRPEEGCGAAECGQRSKSGATPIHPFVPPWGRSQAVSRHPSLPGLAGACTAHTSGKRAEIAASHMSHSGSPPRCSLALLQRLASSRAARGESTTRSPQGGSSPSYRPEAYYLPRGVSLSGLPRHSHVLIRHAPLAARASLIDDWGSLMYPHPVSLPCQRPRFCRERISRQAEAERLCGVQVAKRRR